MNHDIRRDAREIRMAYADFIAGLRRDKWTKILLAVTLFALGVMMMLPWMED